MPGGPDCRGLALRLSGETEVKGQKAGAWLAVGIGVGVAMGAATHAMAEWICIGAVVGAAIGIVVGRLGKRTP
jgi:hypothetical protein